jgi:glycosyltransferase involved in cell wall biosynthesis
VGKMISIIVPIFKVEKYLPKCIESIQNQTYKNIEIILVDDGSPDSCGEICESYSKKDPRIKVIHKVNGGLSDARNAGLNVANGDYVLFLDSDDYIDEQTCEKMLISLNNEEVDVLYGNCTWIYNDREVVVKRRNITEYLVYNGYDFLKTELKTGSFSMQAWLGLFRRDFLIKNNLFFKFGILHEDEQWTPRVLLAASKVKYIDFSFYNYVIREDSITQKKDQTRNASSLLDICYDLNNYYDRVKDLELKRLLDQYLLKLFLKAVYIGYKYGDKNQLDIDKKFVHGKAITIKENIRVIIFNISVYGYCNLHEQWLNRNERNVKY